MKRFVQLTMGLLGAIILVVFVTKLATSGMDLDGSEALQTERGEQLQQSAERLYRNYESGDATEFHDEPTPKTKVKERSGSEEQAQKRMERRRIELVETLEEYEDAGMGDNHPAVVKATDDLWRIIEAEQAASSNH